MKLTVSPGLQAELQEMRDVEVELTVFTTRQLAACLIGPQWRLDSAAYG